MSRVTPAMRVLARRIVALETSDATQARNPIPAAFRACEKLRGKISCLISHVGVCALLSRAVAVAAEKVPWLRAVCVGSDGAFIGLEKVESSVPARKYREESVHLLVQLLSLLSVFIGETLTLRMVCEVWATLPLAAAKPAPTTPAAPRVPRRANPNAPPPAPRARLRRS